MDFFLQNSVTVIKIHQCLCTFNYVQCGAGLHLSEPNVRGPFFGTHCICIFTVCVRYFGLEGNVRSHLRNHNDTWRAVKKYVTQA